MVTWSHAISHLHVGRLIVNGSLKVIELQLRFKVCNSSYVLFHSSELLFILLYINHKKDQRKRMHSCYNYYNRIKAVTRVSFLVRQGVWGPHMSSSSPGQRSSRSPGAKPPMKLRLYLKLQEYFGYENHRTHVIKVAVLVVKINFQMTSGIHCF